MKTGLIVDTQLAICLLLAISIVGCKRTTTPQSQTEDYIPAEGAAGFGILRLANDGEAQRWLATYTDGGRTTRFTIELQPVAKERGSAPVAKGRFVAVPTSDPVPLLDSLKTALQAQRLPSHVQKADALAFDYLLLGENQSRDSSGSFRQSPAGNWTVMKVVFAGDQAEVYLNLNPAIHQGEFAIKDATYGNRVLAELAKVL